MCSASHTLVTLAVLGLLRPSVGNVFLAKTNETSRFGQFMNESSIKHLLFEEVHGLMGKGQADVQLPVIQKALEPMWLSLPKNQYGNLGTAEVKYALHRLFVQRHGWRIDGLDSMGQSSGSAESDGSPTNLLRERVPSFLMDVFEEAFGKTGLKQHELSIFAATLEHIIHDEATARLHDVYEALGSSSDSQLSLPQVDLAADAYTMSLIMGQHRLKTPGSIQDKLARLARAYPGWKDTQLWLREVRKTVAPANADDGLSFKQVEDVAEQISQRFGSFQDTECRQLKNTLLQAEDRDTGRVLLSDFYKKGLETNSLFKESVDHLREQGALDESKPGEPRVIVSNFLLSPSNCLADTGLYSVCCMNECEGLLAHLEKTIAAPEATPEKIVEIVSSLSSSSVEAPRTLPARLVSQIELVGMRHGGMVPLHSRSLAQWLHIAFPRECPYPHVASARSTLTTSELKASFQTTKLDVDSREKYIAAAQQQEDTTSEPEQESTKTEEELLAQWSHEEEILYMPAAQPSFLRRQAGKFAKLVLGLLVVAGAAALLTDVVRRSSGQASYRGLKQKEHLV